MKKGTGAALLLFSLKFFVILVPLVLVWWLYALPWYGEFLKQAAGGMLKFVFGFNIIAGEITTKGLFNTESTLTFVFDDHEPTMPIAQLVSNIPPYLALVLATPALGVWRRLRIIAYGFSVLSGCHIAFLVFAMRIQEYQIDHTKFPTAIAQFFLTLPFLLWIVFAYWDRLMAMINDNPARNSAAIEKEPRP